jgi:molecular chaperone HscA
MPLLQFAEPDLENNKPKSKNHALKNPVSIGIDLGTTNSLVATVINNKPSILKDQHTQEELIPSVVHYAHNGSITVGKNALEYKISDPENTIISVKRMLSHDNNLHHNKNLHINAKIKTSDGIKTPIEVSSAILKYLKEIAREHLGYEPIGAVITVPAYFDDAGRLATKLAAIMSGINVLRLLNEPTAAAIAYGLESKKTGTFLVYDLGGGTLDVSILRIQDGVFEVLAVNGNTHLGGDDFDDILRNYIQNAIGLTEPLNSTNIAILSAMAKLTKEKLSTHFEYNLTMDFQAKLAAQFTGSKNRHSTITITQAKFIELSQSLIEQTIVHVKLALRDAKLKFNDIDEVILVGGSTRMPSVRSALTKLFNKPPLTDIDPDKVVALGAAIHADNLLSNKNQADCLLLDVTPLSLGIETLGDRVETIIPRNSTIPISRAQEFTTYVDNQTAISIHILQGEGQMVSECRHLAKFSLKDLPLKPAGQVRIRVIFQIDADGILSVHAFDIDSAISKSIEVNPSSNLSSKDVVAMLKSGSSDGSTLLD